jgi:hypothetical protein
VFLDVFLIFKQSCEPRIFSAARGRLRRFARRVGFLDLHKTPVVIIIVHGREQGSFSGAFSVAIMAACNRAACAK